MAELDGRRIAAVFAADAAMHRRTHRFAHLDRHIHQFADADLVEFRKRIGFVDLVRIVRGQEFAGVVTREAEGHLRQIVGAEAEELRLFRHLVRGERRARDLDHRADFVFEVALRFRDQFVRRFDDDLFDERKFFHFAGERDHDLGNDVPIGMLFLDADRRFDDGSRLHLRDLGIGDRQAAAAVTHHRVEFVQVCDDLFDLRDRLLLRLGKRRDVLFGGRNELMQRRIEEADGDGIAAQRLVQFFEVGLLHRLDLGESRFALFDGVGADHLAERGDPCRIEEHVLGTAKADALRAERGSLFRILRGIRVGADRHCLVLVGQFHDAPEIAAVRIGGNGRDQAVIDGARGAVQRNAVALFEHFAREGELLVLLVHLDVAAAGDAAGTHAARDDRRMRRLSAADGEDALRILHAFDVLRRGLEADENDLFAFLALFDCIFRREDDGTRGSAGRGRDALADDVFFVRFLESLGIELRVQQHVKRLRVDLHERFLLGDHALVDEVARDLDRGGGGTFAVTRLQHVEFFVFDGELHILHVAVMIFEDLADILELFIHIGEYVCHLGDGHRGTDARDDVLALCVGEEFAHQALFAGGGVTRERDARAAVVAHVAERHHLDVDGRAPTVRDVVIHAVDVRTGVVPRTEDRFDRAEELFLRVGREVGADLLFIFGLELVGEFFEVVRRQFDVLCDALLFLHLVDELFKIFFADFHDDVGIHLDETAIAVPRPAGIAGFCRDGLDHFFVETEVEDGVHHAGHGSARARTDGDEQGVLFIAELLAADVLHLVDILHDLRLDGRIDLPAVLIVLRACFRGDREALRHGKTDVGHLCKVRALAAEEFAHLCIAFREKVAIFFCHKRFPPVSIGIFFASSLTLSFYYKTSQISSVKIKFLKLFTRNLRRRARHKKNAAADVPQTLIPAADTPRRRARGSPFWRRNTHTAV